MRAIQIDRVGGPEVMQLVEREVREPGPGDVRVRHGACGVNYIDTYQRSGLPHRPAAQLRARRSSVLLPYSDAMRQS